ncbi:GS1-like protein [Apodospora peruviana]|uniref:GS1-like protein n=1 Tax=Apodospora peruviana TaxID=516989 RepID=A0AAE0M1S4_9PEZI|nr:GS1-like protein [Apodospora peruviana]
MPATDFPPVRACIFDMDGLLINTEGIYEQCADNVLVRHGRPPLPWSIKAQLMGIPGSSNGDVFHEWAELPISRDQYGREQELEQEKLFCALRPPPQGGSCARDSPRVAASTRLLAPSVAFLGWSLTLLDLIPPERRVLADDEKMKRANRKPAPDIFLMALEGINATLSDDKKLSPAECLVFEDSLPRVEAGRRAGMRVVWVPHPDLKIILLEGRRGFLQGRTGIVPIGKEEQLGEIGDGWAEEIASLEDFEYNRVIQQFEYQTHKNTDSQT